MEEKSNRFAEWFLLNKFLKTIEQFYSSYINDTYLLRR